MNQRNVEALKALLVKARGHPYRHPYLGPSQAEFVARFLAEQGVIVPSAITADQMRDLGELIESETAGSGWTDPEAIIESAKALERVADGKPVKLGRI